MASPKDKTDVDPNSTLPRKDRRAHRRVDLSLSGRCLNADQEDFQIETVNLSCAGAMMTGERTPAIGSEVICYFEQLGRVAGTVVRSSTGGFAIEFDIHEHKRDKLADRLTWLLNKESLGLSEERASKRHDTDAEVSVVRRNGLELQCRVRDISLSGASFQTRGPLPVIGEIISVGNVHGRVVRIGDGGFAVSYLRSSEVSTNQSASKRLRVVSSSVHS